MKREDASKGDLGLPLRGIHAGMLCRSKDVMKQMGIGWHAWDKWRSLGLKTITGVGVEAELVLTDDLLLFMKERARTREAPETS